MDLNINSPAYYTNIHGIDDEIYWMCKELSNYMIEKKYSDFLDIIGIVPIIAPRDEIERGLWKEVKKYEIKYKIATVSIRIDYDIYVRADIEKRKSLIIENILKSVKSISKKGRLNYNQFKRDIIIFCEDNNIGI